MSIEVWDDFVTTKLCPGSGTYRHVRVASFDPCLTLDEFKQFIEQRWPGPKFWRRRPQVEEVRDFECNAAFIWFFARFSMEVPNGTNQ